MMMHHQYLTTHDIKFPDQKQYTKPGDLILFNDANASLTIYRDEALIGTVHFSKAGLLEFLRLGWIVRSTDVNAKPTKVAKTIVGVDTGLGKDKTAITVIRMEDGPSSVEIMSDGSPSIQAENITVDQHTVPSELPITKRKTKKS